MSTGFTSPLRSSWGNENCYVESKSWTSVRRRLIYRRSAVKDQLQTLSSWRLFLPVVPMYSSCPQPFSRKCSQGSTSHVARRCPGSMIQKRKRTLATPSHRFRQTHKVSDQTRGKDRSMHKLRDIDSLVPWSGASVFSAPAPREDESRRLLRSLGTAGYLAINVDDRMTRTFTKILR
jgi:hypothetical protein